MPQSHIFDVGLSPPLLRLRLVIIVVFNTIHEKKISGHGKIRRDKERNTDFKYQLQANFASIY